ncbi:MAG: hypothetical protein PHQ27_08640 [Victivallales bacterium]|nr:hypothetical protein [Victivallales bacterium]
MEAISSSAAMQELLHRAAAGSDATAMTPQQQELRRACNEFEAVLTAKMLKEGMQSAKELGGDEEEDSGCAGFKDMAYDQLASFIGRQGMLGLGEMLYNATKDRLKVTGEDK